MTDWTTVPLGEAIELAYGKSLPKALRSDDGKIPVYGSNGITGWHSAALTQEPVVIIGRKGSAGAVQFVDQPCFPIDTTYFVQPRPRFAFDTKFLYYLLLRLDLSRLRTATGVPGLTREDAYRELIAFPGIHEQRRISDLLTRAEGIVRLRREAADKAAELIPAIFIDMFGDPVRNPKAWPIVPLGSVATVQGGLQVTRARLSHPLERPYLRVANVYRDRLDLVEIKSIRLTEAELNRTRLQIGDLLFVEGHGNPQEVGRVAVWDGSIQDCTHQNHLIRARPNNDQLMPEFACVQLNTPAGRQSLLRAGKTTSGLSTISAQNVKDAEVMLPRMALQRDFVKLAEEAQSIATLQTEAQLKAQATFNALLAQAFAPHGSL